MIFLAQTDTTAGFLSNDFKELNKVKNRALNTPCIMTTSSLKKLKLLARVPNRHKNFIRKAKKSTIIYPNLKSIRVVKDKKHNEFLDKFLFLYSTSANLHGEKFNEEFAKSVADEVVDSEFFEKTPSKMYRVSRNKIKKVR
ncbi:threonylcarbamoyl-AMP synthase TsaC [Campylobacter blaseri]|uniref:Sua5 YciO YrdC YwlC family protein n=1 Tax=Campylobacter blaseri TaxID=2042961 RepID=A0A2P8R150_9BACT|nr:Sua5 YciO YrdC YwlC family protein [Campylobacter blaseri]PSM52219.1 Sua5 YciO YrdC YwlC family protein [Campylobacter blaseri]PSM53985.1 Sua5 YciO YrdC YwlC family protein [Campylobacter blaseri]QKF85422.1 threonylcarbamoyl-AMP synthase TsaC [Campylobacter blaseri]